MSIMCKGVIRVILLVQGREGKIVQVYRKKWVIHIERITREKVNGRCPHCAHHPLSIALLSCLMHWKHLC